MRTSSHTLTVIFSSAALLFLVALGALASKGWGVRHREFAEAHIYFELNDTDGDLGIHSLIDGGPWESLEIESPSGRELLELLVSGSLRRQGMTEIFFESAEPSFDELSPERFFERFPEGRYEVEGETLDGVELESEVEVTHLMPAPPENVQISGIPAAEDCDADPLPVVSGAVVITWDPVTHSHPELGRTDEEIEVEKYQVVVEQEDTGLVLSTDLPPEVTALEIPAGFIALGDEWKFEIVVRETGGNQTAVESCFLVE
jgi:hypothetical protein